MRFCETRGHNYLCVLLLSRSSYGPVLRHSRGPMDDASKPTHFRQRIDRYTVRSWTESPQTITKHTDSMSQPSRQTERRAEDGPIIGGSPPFTSPQPPDLQGKFMATATSRDGKRKITAFQFPGAVVHSYSAYLGISRNAMRHIRRRFTLVPET